MRHRCAMIVRFAFFRVLEKPVLYREQTATVLEIALRDAKDTSALEGVALMKVEIKRAMKFLQISTDLRQHQKRAEVNSSVSPVRRNANLSLSLVLSRRNRKRNPKLNRLCDRNQPSIPDSLSGCSADMMVTDVSIPEPFKLMPTVDLSFNLIWRFNKMRPDTFFYRSIIRAAS